jgi:hypothetical protein
MSKTQATQVTTEAQLPYDVNHLTSLPTTSAKIRYLDSLGIKRGQIAKIVDRRYQHVRNVLITPLKRQS